MGLTGVEVAKCGEAPKKVSRITGFNIVALRICIVLSLLSSELVSNVLRSTLCIASLFLLLHSTDIEHWDYLDSIAEEISIFLRYLHTASSLSPDALTHRFP